MSSVISSHPLRLPPPLLATLVSAVAADRPAGDATRFLRQAGYDAGEHLFSLLQERILSGSGGDDVHALPVSRFWEEFSAAWREWGWGTLDHARVHPGVVELTSDGWAEADAAPRGLGCQVTTGMFADLLSRIAGDDVAVLEVECRSRGDARCRFLAGGAATLSALHDALSAGEDTDASLARLA